MHNYLIELQWTGNTGRGTADYRAYERTFEIAVANKPTLLGSSDPAFRGDSSRYNPEEMLLMALSSCHMLWYLHLCADAGIVVTEYLDTAIGRLELNEDGSGQFARAILQPIITLQNPDKQEAAAGMHARAREMCFIARSVNFPVLHRPTFSANAL